MVIYAQFMTKWRIGVLAASLEHTQDKWGRLLVYFSDPLILSTYVAALAGSVAWVFVVERYDIAIAFPVYVGLTVFSVALIGVFAFGEHINMVRAFGILLIVIGVALAGNS